MVEETALISGSRFGDYNIQTRLSNRVFWPTFEARHATTGEKVELQCVHESALGSSCPPPDAFFEALSQLRKLDYPLLPKTRDGGIHDGIRWIARDRVRGVPLVLFREEAQPPTMAEALADVAYVATAIREAAKLGVYHGNLNPGVCLVTRKYITLLDVGSFQLFGLAPGVIRRSPLYRAPEQIAFGGVHERSDVYSLGMILYGNLLGRPPYVAGDGSTPEDILDRIEKGPPEQGSIHPLLWDILLCMIGKTPADRYSVERAASTLIQLATMVKNDEEIAPKAAEQRRVRDRKRHNDVQSFAASPSSETTSGYRIQAKEEDASGPAPKGPRGEPEKPPLAEKPPSTPLILGINVPLFKTGEPPPLRSVEALPLRSAEAPPLKAAETPSLKAAEAPPEAPVDEPAPTTLPSPTVKQPSAPLEAKKGERATPWIWRSAVAIALGLIFAFMVARSWLFSNTSELAVRGIALPSNFAAAFPRAPAPSDAEPAIEALMITPAIEKLVEKSVEKSIESLRCPARGAAPNTAMAPGNAKPTASPPPPPPGPALRSPRLAPDNWVP